MLVNKPKPSRKIDKIVKKDNMILLSAEAGTVFISPKSEQIIKITYLPDDNYKEIETASKIKIKDYTDWNYSEEKDSIFVCTPKVKTVINKQTGSIRFYDNADKLLLSETDKDSKNFEAYDSFVSIESEKAKSHKVMTADGEKIIVDSAEQIFDKELFKSVISFKWQKNEKLFGLGQNENGDFNLIETTQYIYQKNKKISIPFIQSICGYGLLIDSYAPMIFKSNKLQGSFYTEADVACSYYFIAGKTFDETISAYRYLTGKATMLPKWAYGFIQSMERYETADELINCIKRHREEDIGIDCVVLDWMSWEGDKWGQKTFDKTRFPNPKKMMDDIHSLNGHLMVSVWPNMRNGCDNYNEFKDNKLMLPNIDRYNAFIESGRKLYWKQAKQGLFDNNIDAWWCDSSEPITTEWSHKIEYSEEQTYSETFNKSKNVMPPELTNTYALYHAKGIYDGQRSTDSEKRVFNLTRSAYSGQQKFGCCMWSGDTSATWQVYRNQLISGLQFSVTGIPYWTFDIGAFFTKTGGQWFRYGDYDKGTDDLGYCELYTRWYQLGAFMPIFRSHGTDTYREIWNFKKKNNTVFYDAIKSANRLRYKLMPTIYSDAFKVWKYDKSILRMLAFDFSYDDKALYVKDEFMFGNNILVCPVESPILYNANSVPVSNPPKTRTVYLPEGRTWTDFYTNKVYNGGRNIEAEIEISKIPLFIPSGSILFTTNEYHFADENKDNNITVNIYGGNDIEEHLFIDDGDNYTYEKDNYCEIIFSWNDTEKNLNISKPIGKWWNNYRKATFIVLYNGNKKEVNYFGKEINMKF